MNKLTRRSFLKRSLLTSASFSLLPGFAVAPGRVLGANEDIRVAVLGVRNKGRGQSHLEAYRKIPGVRLVAICDVDREALDKEMGKCQSLGEKVQGYSDIRKLLENKEVDAVSIATPNHWHSLAAIWAIQAGKDVYVEKPVSHNVWEGRQLVNAARKHQRIVQTGTQCRSSQGIQQAMQWLREGHIGKILCARGLCYKPRPSIGKVEGPQPIPAGVDYDLWCGPAPKDPLMRKNLHYDWHWVWPTGNGDLGNQGIHQVDLARWALGETALSPRILAVGGRLGYVDDGTTPNTLVVLHDYPTAPLIFEVRGLPTAAGKTEMDAYLGAKIGLVVECEGGHMLIPDYSSATFYDKDGAKVKEFKGARDHFANFIAAVHSRKASDLNADILEGHLSSALCHTGNISYRLGKSHLPEEARETVKADKLLAEALGRMEKHLAANNIDLRKTPVTLGAVLAMDPQAERFTDNAAANQLLRREYREPFVVPATV